MARLHEDIRWTLQRDLSGTGWYPIQFYAAIHDAVRAVTGGGLTLCRRLGREARKHDARGVYHFVLRFGSPEAAARHADKILALYTDGPMVQVGSVERGDGIASVCFEYTNASGYDENLWQDVLGSMEVIFEMTGASGVHILCHEGGTKDWMRGEVRWSTRPII